MTLFSRHALSALVVTATLFLSGCSSDYAQGYLQGQREAQKLRKEFGSFTKPLHNLAEGIGFEPHIDGKSADWNRGYRQGVRDEMKK